VAQPAHAMQTPNPSQDSYAQYAKAYTQGYLASTSTDQPQTMSCQDTEPATTSEPAAPQATATSYHTTQTPPSKHLKPMSHDEWTKNVQNSYNNYMSTTNKTEVNTKNINSNNTSNSSVSVSDSNGAVVSSNTTAAGSNFNKTDVNNIASNNTVAVNDSFNKDSHNNTAIVKDSGNTTVTKTTNNTSVINDSFNKEDKSVNVNSGNTIEDNSHTYIKTEDGHSHHHV
jgi:hypothetical protein